MAISQDIARQELREKLASLENLNADLTQTALNHIMELAHNVGADFFDEAAEQAFKLAEMYVNSDVKKVGSDIMAEYFGLMKKCANLLNGSGEIKLLEQDRKQAFSTALVPLEQTSPLDFCKIINRAEIPKPLVKAADAFRRRNEVVSTVFHIAMRVLWIINPEKTAEWIIQLYDEKEGNLDPDIVRDTLSTALSSGYHLPARFIEWAITFASDQNLLEYWPNVVHYADRVIFRNTLEDWFAKNPPKSTLLAQLRLYIRSGKVDDDTILDWHIAALEEIGNCVQRFMSLDKAGLDASWKSSALVSELKRIADLFGPVMITADHLLDLPDGTDQLAMAFMGLSGKSRQNWEDSLEKYAFRAVKLSFLLDLKAGRKPVETIERLSFGDASAYRAAMAQLDLGSQNFDSPKQRDKVCSLLAVFYAGFRRPQLLGYEISKRYRNLMRLVHDDFLSVNLDGQQLDEIHAIGILQEISSIASESRKYLGKRKASENSLEQVLAAKIGFERFVREKRASIVRKCSLA